MSFGKILIKKYWPLLILILIFGWLFFNLLSSHMLLQKPDGLYSGGSTWGDLPFHLSLVNSFVNRGNLAFQEHPVYIGSPLRYPFLTDLIAAGLIKIGVSLRVSLIVPSWIFLILLVAAIYFLTLKISKSRIGAFLAPFIFFFNGAIYSLRYFWQDFKLSGMGFWKFLGNMSKEYGHLADHHIEFSNIIADYILPQRAVILGLLLGVIVVYLLWLYWENKDRKKLLWAGVVLGILPLVHTHTFMALCFVALFLALINLWQDRKNFKKIIVNWLYFGIPLLIVALPSILWLFPKSSPGFFKFGFGWMKDTESFSSFWFKNLGVYLILFIVAFIFSRPKVRSFYLAFFGLFIITNLFIFQPNIYDNMKIMLWWFLLSIILAAEFFQYLRNKIGYKSFLIIIPIFILLIPTGFLSVLRESYVSWQLFSNEDIALANFVKDQTPSNAIFLTSDKHNNPVPCLAGRRIVMGYRGWLWTHGIDYRQREADVMGMYQGSSKSLSLIADYKVSYALIEMDKIYDFGINSQFFFEHFPVIYQSQNYILFKINQNKV